MSFDDKQVVILDSVDLVAPARIGVEGDLDLAVTIVGVDVDGKRNVGRREVNEVDKVQANEFRIGVDEVPFDDELFTGFDFGVLLRVDEFDGRGHDGEKGKGEKAAHVAGWIGLEKKEFNSLGPSAGA